jgi:pantoate--beta-alanine ligase
MDLVRSISEVRKKLKSVRSERRKIGFVPTMGYFHKGHLSLMKKARMECDFVVVSLFINPMQFGPREDYHRYPRDLERDKSLARKCGVDLLFTPSVEEMYPEKQLTWVEVNEITDVLCGKFRPGHFKGVATVVAKLFNIIQPDVAYFGEKDYQQLQVIKKMVKDLNFSVEIVGLPTVREEDGLAMSSRNTYLSERERKSALLLSKSLRKAQELYEAGERDARAIKKSMLEVLDVPEVKLQYLEIMEAESLKPLKKIEGNALVALAAYVGETRLIDNLVLGRRETYV